MVYENRYAGCICAPVHCCIHFLLGPSPKYQFSQLFAKKCSSYTSLVDFDALTHHSESIPYQSAFASAMADANMSVHEPDTINFLPWVYSLHALNRSRSHRLQWTSISLKPYCTEWTTASHIKARTCHKQLLFMSTRTQQLLQCRVEGTNGADALLAIKSSLFVC